jgi:hypothetical protein
MPNPRIKSSSIFLKSLGAFGVVLVILITGFGFLSASLKPDDNKIAPASISNASHAVLSSAATDGFYTSSGHLFFVSEDYQSSDRKLQKKRLTNHNHLGDFACDRVTSVDSDLGNYPVFHLSILKKKAATPLYLLFQAWKSDLV